MKSLSKEYSKGFSLVELGVSLAIIGMIISSAMSVAITNDYDVKLGETERKLDRIEEALAGFVALNHRMPCPANGTTATTEAGFGEEGAMAPNNGGRVCPNSNFNSTNTHIGVVPVTTLQLPQDFMFDGWGRRFTYAVDWRVANSQETNPTCTDPGDNCFENRDTANPQVLDANGGVITGNAIYVVLSHGENGHGAFPKNGGAARVNAFGGNSPYGGIDEELENANVNDTFANNINNRFQVREYIRVDDNSIVNPDNRLYYDDIVRFKEKEVLLREAGAVIFNNICQIATDVVDGPGNNDCTGAIGEEDCEAFSIEIYKRCLQ